MFSRAQATTAISLLILPSLPALAGSVSLTIENDSVLGEDSYYTSGVFLGWNSDSYNDLVADAPTFVALPAQWLPLKQDTNKGYSFEVGQMMWTPTDITFTTPQPNERPYAGLIYIDGSIYQQSASQADKWSAMLGVVGPASKTEEGQSFVHEHIGSDDPKGWDYQVENHAVGQLGMESHRLLMRSGNHELSYSARADLGNFRSDVGVGAIYRWGIDLENTFGGISFEPGKHVDRRMMSNSKHGMFLFAAAEGRYRFNDITIDGDKPAENDDVSVEHIQGTAAIGLAYYQPSWGVDFSIALHSRDHKEAPHDTYSYGSLTAYYRY